MFFNTSLYLRAPLVLLFLFACLIAPAHAGVPSYERSLFYSDLDAETYSVYLDDSALITDKAIGVTNGKGVGDILFGFAGGITAGARFILDDLQVGASDAPILPSELQFMVTPTEGYVNQAITPGDYAMVARAAKVKESAPAYLTIKPVPPPPEEVFEDGFEAEFE